MRKLLKITSRTSSITNAFVQAIIPHLVPSDEERSKALAVLGQTSDKSKMTCVYCGTPASDWDHFRPLVKNKRPTGYINEIRNLVPACSKCNQSKSGQDWRAWMLGNAKGSPKTRKIPDLDKRVARLEAFEMWGNVSPLGLEALIGKETWESYWNHLHEIENRLHTAQSEAVKVREAIMNALKLGLKDG